MLRRTAATKLRRIAGETRARRDHFRTARAVKGELEKKGIEEAVERFDGEVSLLEQLADALERGGDVDELLAGVDDGRTIVVGS